MKTRGVRFSEEELRLIDEFLRQNAFLDFSTLARLAISRFIEEPTVEIKPVRSITKLRDASRVEKE